MPRPRSSKRPWKNFRQTPRRIGFELRANPSGLLVGGGKMHVEPGLEFSAQGYRPRGDRKSLRHHTVTFAGSAERKADFAKFNSFIKGFDWKLNSRGEVVKRDGSGFTQVEYEHARDVIKSWRAKFGKHFTKV